MPLEPQKLFDLTVLHSVNLTLWGSGVLRRIMSQLNNADTALFDRLSIAALNNPESGAVAHLDAMLTSVQGLNASAYMQASAMTSKELLALASVEAGWQQAAYAAPGAPLAGVTGEQAYAAAMARPMQGVLLKEVLPELAGQRMKRLRDAVRTGYLTGQTTADIVRGLRGTKAKSYRDGVIEIDRARLETVVRTAISHTAATARNLFFEQNKDLVASQLWVSTLDGHTSRLCIVRSGKRYTTGDNPKPIGHLVPWCEAGGCGPGRLHWNCRSTAIGLLAGQERLFGTRAQAGGQIDANISFGDWLRQQTQATQVQLLGARRAQLFDAGQLDITRFTTDRGRWIGLQELQARDAEAFRRAGL